MRQTKLCVSQKDKKLTYEGFVPEPPRLRPREEFVYVPTPQSLPPPANKVLEKSLPSAPLPPKNLRESGQEKDTSNNEDVQALMSKGGRDLINLIGRVEFCLKTNKMYPHLNVIWNVYGG